MRALLVQLSRVARDNVGPDSRKYLPQQQPGGHHRPRFYCQPTQRYAVQNETETKFSHNDSHFELHRQRNTSFRLLRSTYSAKVFNMQPAICVCFVCMAFEHKITQAALRTRGGCPQPLPYDKTINYPTTVDPAQIKYNGFCAHRLADRRTQRFL